MRVLAYVHLRNILGSTGAGRVARQMTECLSKLKDMDLRILADPDDHKRVVDATGKPWTNFRYHFLERATSRQQARWFLAETPKAESYWKEAQIVYCTAESYVPTRRARLAVTLHDAAYFEPDAHRRGATFWKQRLKWNLLFGRLARKADLFHTVSQFSAERLGHYFPAIKSRLRVVHNGIVDRFFEPASSQGEEALQALGVAGRRFILVPGGLHFRKNAELILSSWPQIAQDHPDVLLVIANHCDPAYGERSQSLGARVRLTGFVDDETLCSLHRAASVVWFPSRYEGFGMPVLEAMASGAPVVASDSSSLPEVCGGAALLASPIDGSEHVEAIRSVLNHSRTRTELIAKGSERAKLFRWPSAAAKLEAEFAAIL